jgi:hypothetical protein
VLPGFIKTKVLLSTIEANGVSLAHEIAVRSDGSLIDVISDAARESTEGRQSFYPDLDQVDKVSTQCLLALRPLDYFDREPYE